MELISGCSVNWGEIGEGGKSENPVPELVLFPNNSNNSDNLVKFQLIEADQQTLEQLLQWLLSSEKTQTLSIELEH